MSELTDSLHGFVSDIKSPIIEVFYLHDHPPIICGINGSYCYEMVDDIEDSLSESPEKLDKGDGSYLYRATYISAQVGDEGRVELEACWDLDFIAYRPIQANQGVDK